MRVLTTLLLAALPASAAERLVPFVNDIMQPFAFDFHKGDMILAEFGAHRIVRIDPHGHVSVIAGSGKVGRADGIGDKAEFNAPHNLVVARDGSIYVADSSNHTVRKIDPKTREVTTIAGGEAGDAGDGGPAKAARFSSTYHVCLDPKETGLYVCDLGNRRIRRIDLASSTISTVAGNGKRGVPADGATATEAPLVDPRAMTFDPKGRLWILERSGNALRVVEDGKIRTVAGSGKAGFSGDGGPALKAELNGPKSLWIDPHGDVLIADTENHCIRKVSLADGTIDRIAGTGKKGAGEAGAPREVALTQPHGVGLGPDGTLYIADSTNGRVLKRVAK